MRLVALRLRPPGRGGPGRPYPAETVAEVRGIVEGTRMPVPAIARETGIPLGTIYAWAARGGWQRPPGAPAATRRARRRAEETAPGAARTWRARFLREAEAQIAALERAGGVDVDGLAAALGLLAAAAGRPPVSCVLASDADRPGDRRAAASSPRR